MVKNSTDLDESTRFAMPIRNLITIVTAVSLGVWAWFGVQERLNRIETNQILVDSDLKKNSEFRVKWPRGELGSLPADSEQFMLIEHMSNQFAKLSKMLEEGKAPFDQQQALTLIFFEKRIANLENKMEELRDVVSILKAEKNIEAVLK